MSRNRHNFPKAFDMTTLTQEDLSKVYNLEFKSPVAAWWLQVLFGSIGAGRLYVGDWKIGLAQAALTLFLNSVLSCFKTDLFKAFSVILPSLIKTPISHLMKRIPYHLLPLAAVSVRLRH